MTSACARATLRLLFTAGLITSCGGGETTTVVQTVGTTVTVGAQPAVPTTSVAEAAPEATTPPTATTPVTTPPSEPLPGGRPAVQGRYEMAVHGTSYTGENLNGGVSNGSRTRWQFETTCDGDACGVEARRGLTSGAFETLQLDAIDDRSYAASSTGEVRNCVLAGGKAEPSRERVSIRVTKVEDVNGRPTATRLDAYLVVRNRCRGYAVRNVTSWRGSRVSD